MLTMRADRVPAVLRQRVMGNGAVRFGMALVREIAADDVPGMAAEMAYRFLFALFPVLLLSGAVIGMVAGVLGRQGALADTMAQVTPFLPGAVAEILEGVVLDLITERAGTIALLSLLLAVWGAAGGVGALIKGLNRAYDVTRPRPSWRRQLVAMVATLVLPVAGLLLLTASIVGHSLTTWLGEAAGVSDIVAAIVAALQVPLAFIVFFAGMSLVYWTLPALRQRYREVLPGSLVATVGWTALTQAFGVYVADIEQYRAAYGAFGAAIAFLLWLYLAGLVVLLGAEINALLTPNGRRSWAGSRAENE